MPHSLEQFAADCRAALMADPGPGGRQAVRRLLEEVLKDRDFIDRHVPADSDAERRVLYEDPDLGFCICAHVYKGAKRGSPHDHGPSWAIYGQAAGETEMTDWRIVSPPDELPRRVELARRYKLKPGDVHVYEPGDVHAPLRDAPTRLIRIEGRNMDNTERTPIVQAA